MAIAEEEKGEEMVKAAIQYQYRKESMPAHFDAQLIDGLPNSPGVYYFWGENKEPLYIGKSINIRKRVLSHFTADHKSSREMKICQQTRNITFDKTPGELSALILESQKVKALQPVYNRKLRRVKTFFSIHLNEADEGILKPDILPVTELPGIKTKLYGLFASNKKATQAIEAICDEHNLCYIVCGLERGSNRGCSSHQLKKCRGYCVGKQSSLQHNVKMLEGMGNLALQTWPYDGPIAITESDKEGNHKHLIVNNWCLLGIADSLDEIFGILNGNTNPQLDKDSYRYLVKIIFGKSSSVVIRQLTL